MMKFIKSKPNVKLIKTLMKLKFLIYETYLKKFVTYEKSDFTLLLQNLSYKFFKQTETK